MSIKKKILVFTTVAGTATLTIHLINKSINYLSALDNTLNPAKGTYYNWRFGNIFYKKLGAGAPILLIHDSECYSSTSEWNKTIKLLAKTNTVYALDLLGCGCSEKPNITYTNFLYVQLIQDFIKDIIKEKTHIVTSNESSSIAVMATAFNCEYINDIVLINPVDINKTLAFPTKRSRLLKQFISTPVFGTFLYNILNTKRSIEDKFLETFYANSELIDSSDVKSYHEAAHLSGSNSKYLFSSIKSSYLSANVIHALFSINNSIYIIASDSSPNYLTFSEQYKKLMPSIEIFSIKDSAKYPQLETPCDLAAQIQLLLNNE